MLAKLYVNKIRSKKYLNHVIQPLSSADNSLDKAVLINVIANFMMSTKLATPDFSKCYVSRKCNYEVIFSVYDITLKFC